MASTRRPNAAKPPSQGGGKNNANNAARANGSTARGGATQQPPSKPKGNAAAQQSSRQQVSPQQSSRLAEIRQRTGTSGSAGRGAARRRAAKQKPWVLRGATPAILSVVIVIVLVGIFVGLANRPAAKQLSGIGDPVSPQVMSEITNVSPKVFDTVGTGGLPDPLLPLSNLGPLTGSQGKPEFLYVGAEFCPYCAAERWSMIVALSRFGTFSNLHYMESSSTDVNPNTPTFTFLNSSYSSKYLDLVAIENEDRNQQPLQSLNSQQQQLFSTIGGNGYPFLDIANQYSSGGSQYAGGYDPGVLDGLTWQQIASKLNNPNDPVTKDIVGNANYLTAAICKATNNGPSSVCGSKTIQQIEQQLPKGK